MSVKAETERIESIVTVGLLGNPNCGKTTLFNALTGSHVKAANWPGVTVERMEGEIFCNGVQISLVDLPGVYRLDSGSMEEQISADWLASGEADVIINVVNATALERNLYLTLQLLERKVPVVMALNLMDAAKHQGIRIDTAVLSAGLGGIPVVPVSARQRTGLEQLLDKVVRQADPEAAGGRTDGKWRRIHYTDEKLSGRRGVGRQEKGRKEEKRQGECGADILTYAEQLAARAVTGAGNRHRGTDRADRILVHPIWGIPIFCLMMALVFTLTFTMGDRLKGYLELLLQWIMDGGRQLFAKWGVSDWISSLVFDGMITGVGGILTFLPNLLILYLSLALLEDSGYMARAAYVMNETMGLLGLSGKAFLPLILGFGCTVPATAAARVLDNQREKRKVLALLPFMSCSAKLPIYILFAGAFFGSHAVFVTYVLCVAGAVLGLVLNLAAYRKKYRKRRKQSADGSLYEEGILLLELPDYRMPDVRTVCFSVWEKVRDYLSRAGSVIFLASMALWFMLGYGPKGVVGAVEESFAALLGKLLVPLFRPAGFGLWQLCVALICGLSAKEVVVSACMVLFRVEGANVSAGATVFSAGAAALQNGAEALPAGAAAFQNGAEAFPAGAAALQSSAAAFQMGTAAVQNGTLTGSGAFRAALESVGLSPAGALAYMVFCLLYSPCTAAVAAIRRESGSTGWTAWLVARQTLLAWAAAVVTYQVAEYFIR